MNNKPHHTADPDAVIRPPDGELKHVYTFKPRAFNIVWGSDNRYWKIPPDPTRPSMSSQSDRSNTKDEVAELIQVSWLEVTGSVQELKPDTTYRITFTLSFKRDAFGWGSPVFLMAKVGKKGKYKWKRLKELDSLPREPIDAPSDEDSFTVESGPRRQDMRLFFGLYEVWSGKWKGGLRVHQAIVKEI